MFCFVFSAEQDINKMETHLYSRLPFHYSLSQSFLCLVRRPQAVSPTLDRLRTFHKAHMYSGLPRGYLRMPAEFTDVT